MSDTTHVDLPEAVTPHPLHLTVDPWWDTLHCLAFGTVSDGLTDVQRLVVESCHLIYVVKDPETGPVLGFEILGLSEFELPDEDPGIWDGPRLLCGLETDAAEQLDQLREVQAIRNAYSADAHDSVRWTPSE